MAANADQTTAARPAPTNPDCRARYSNLDAELANALRAAGHEDFVGDLCNEKAAQARGDVHGCEMLPTEHWRTHCVTSIALAKHAPDLCPWVRAPDLARGRDPLCLARTSDRSLLCNAVTSADDVAECMRIFKLAALRSDGQAQLLLHEQPRSAEADARRGVVLLRGGRKRSYVLADANDLSLVAAAPLASARVAMLIEDGAITRLVWRTPGEAVIAAEGEQLKLTLSTFKAPSERGEPFHVVAEGLIHVGKQDLPVSFELRSYLRDIIDVPKDPDGTRPTSSSAERSRRHGGDSGP